MIILFRYISQGNNMWLQSENYQAMVGFFPFEVSVVVSMGTGLWISHTVTSLSLSRVNVSAFFLIL